jgi:hypothetical protein
MRVVITEDSILVREGLTRLLAETGIEVAAVGDAESFLRAAGPAIRAPESVTCSRTGSATSPNSSTRCTGWPTAATRLTPRSSASS